MGNDIIWTILLGQWKNSTKMLHVYVECVLTTNMQSIYSRTHGGQIRTKIVYAL